MADPRQFGKTAQAKWFRPVSAQWHEYRQNVAHLASAYYQHEVVLAILEAMQTWETRTAKDFAEKFELKPAQIPDLPAW